MQPLNTMRELSDDSQKAKDKAGKRKKKLEEKAAIVEPADSDNEEDSDFEGIINVDFDFFDPKPDDYHGMKALVRSYLDDNSWDIGGLVDTILDQTTVGTVIKTGEDESPIGFITVLNIKRYKDKPFMKSVHQYLKSNCCTDTDVTKLENIFEKHPDDVGLLITERVVNIPEELTPPLYKGLFEEILWATEDEPTEELRDSFKFKYYLIMTRFFRERTKRKKKSGLKNNKKHKAEVSEECSGEMIYTKPEDEMLHQLSEWSSKFPIKSEALAAHEIQGLKQFCLVMLISAEKIEAFKSDFCVFEQQCTSPC